MAIVAGVVAMLATTAPAQAQGGPSMTIGGTASPASYSAIGDKISYSYTVTNTGNVLLSSYGVTNSRGTGLTCTTTTLAPATSAMCTGTYTVTAADIATVHDLDTIATLRATPATGTVADDLRRRLSRSFGTRPSAYPSSPTARISQPRARRSTTPSP